jgi:omega-6 fatty acid desaturase (delta-12 desaturase)
MSDGYRPDNKIAIYQLALAMVRWFGVMWAYHHSYCPFWLYSIVQGLNVMHIFIIYHDCGHNSFFSNSQANYWCNLILSWWIGTPLYWVIYHKLHHGRSGDLSKKPKEWNDTIFFTVEQYQALPTWQRLAYRIFRDPLVFFSAVPYLNWYVKYRIPFSFNPSTTEVSRQYVFFHSLLNTIGVALVFLLAHTVTGVTFYGYFFGVANGALFGMILFHMQHSFNPSFVTRSNWNLRSSALSGSSMVTIPFFLKSWTMGIEYHHIHHYSTVIPGYKLQRCHEEGEKKAKDMWKDLNVLGYAQMFECLKFTLYDDKAQLFRSFGDVEAAPA